MATRVALSMAVMMCLLASAAHGADDDRAAFEARLKAGREAAYKKYLIQAPVAQQGTTSAPSAPDAPAKLAVIRAPRGAARIFAGHETPYAFGDLRYNFYDNMNLHRRQRWSDYALAPYIFQPQWDWRYRRSWPRPVVVREYVRSHWLFDGTRYTYVPGHAEYQTRWVVQGWPRYHWRGSHYSVSVSFNR